MCGKISKSDRLANTHRPLLGEQKTAEKKQRALNANHPFIQAEAELALAEQE